MREYYLIWVKGFKYTGLLSAYDASLPNRNSYENQELLTLYKEFYGKPRSPLAEEILHTKYEDRSGSLGEPVAKYQKPREKSAASGYEEVTKPGDNVRKWKCRVCGYIWEGEEPPAECPLCHMDSSYFDEIKKWKCRVCGYECEGVEPPAECPLCHKDSSYFDEV